MDSSDGAGGAPLVVLWPALATKGVLACRSMPRIWDSPLLRGCCSALYSPCVLFCMTSLCSSASSARHSWLGETQLTSDQRCLVPFPRQDATNLTPTLKHKDHLLSERRLLSFSRGPCGV